MDKETLRKAIDILKAPNVHPDYDYGVIVTGDVVLPKATESNESAQGDSPEAE